MRLLPCNDGTLLKLCPKVMCRRTDVGYLLTNTDHAIAVLSGFDGEITKSDANKLVLLGLAYSKGSLIFDNPEFCAAVFSWSCLEEIEFLENIISINRHELGLDVACGFGRLTIPLILKGLQLDGIDESLGAINFLSKSLPVASKSRLYCCSIETFISPGSYSYAFAAMNSLRYLENKFALRRHLQAMAQNLKSGSPYLFCVSIPRNPEEYSKQSWSFLFDDQEYYASWSRVRYCHLKEQIIDQVEITNTSGELVFSELQLQAHYSVKFMKDLFKDNELWYWEASFQNNYRPIDLTSEAVSGTYWILLRRI